MDCGHSNVTAGNRIYLVRITLVEVISAISRKARGAGITAVAAGKAIADFRRDFANQYGKLDVTITLMERAADLAEIHGLRAYDAVQLAAAIDIRDGRVALGLSPVTLVSADSALNAAGGRRRACGRRPECASLE